MESQGLAVSGSPRPSPCPCRLPWLQSPQNLLCTPPHYLPPKLHDPLCWESGPLLRGLDSSSFASVGCHFLAEENPSLGQLTRQLDPFLSLCPFRQAPRRAFPPILDVDDRWPGIPLGMGFLIILGVRAKRMMEATPLGPSDLGAPPGTSVRQSWPDAGACGRGARVWHSGRLYHAAHALFVQGIQVPGGGDGRGPGDTGGN